MEDKTISKIQPMKLHLPVLDPFLFCAHHLDFYPGGNEKMGPAASLAGRDLGQDFTPRDGWRMYHGTTVPGFPEHPHRGFETVTIVIRGYVDHFDSWGQTGRYGAGDVQWMTAGAGMQHSEMFPLLNTDGENTTELFQVWLNLPRAGKFTEPCYRMFWKEKIPVSIQIDEKGKKSEISVIAGNFGEKKALAPPEASWAAKPENNVAIWNIMMEAGASLTLPSVPSPASRYCYFYSGSAIVTDGTVIESGNSFELKNDRDIVITNSDKTGYLIILQGNPLNEPVVQYGPFVMNTEDEIKQAFADYRRNQFGGWPWSAPDEVNPRNKGRFALYADGTEENP